MKHLRNVNINEKCTIVCVNDCNRKKVVPMEEVKEEAASSKNWTRTTHEPAWGNHVLHSLLPLINLTGVIAKYEVCHWKGEERLRAYTNTGVYLSHTGDFYTDQSWSTPSTPHCSVKDYEYPEWITGNVLLEKVSDWAAKGGVHTWVRPGPAGGARVSVKEKWRGFPGGPVVKILRF